ncbi:MAG: hypothetical protein AAFN93_20775 [Bacteroidota bacterium]
MKNYLFTLIMGLLSMISLNSCQKSATSAPSPNSIPTVSPTDDNDAENQFNDYWYSGKAEVSSYNLNQARYGELRNGKATLIFVTEPFSKSKQVKLDYPGRNSEDKVAVMKLNYVKKFLTGIYPYSMMLSTFTPVDSYNYPNTLKVTMSNQEWCGHVFTQMNLEKNNYQANSFSYFESEGDQGFEVEKALLEDEIFNRIRLDYKALPVGKVKVVPGLFHTRLKHKNLKAQQVDARLEEKGEKATYTVKYGNQRTLSVTFGLAFPHKILSWSETSKGIGGKSLTTTAKLDKTLYIDYWTRNSNSDLYLRDSLNLQ